jgi:crotonobetainyl-CoA:carnitine CoA-transferase CaiB-like acyl-CoA transferase
LRVLDLSRVVAAPTAAKLLGQLGADVVKVDEDPERARAAFRMPAMHEHLNRGKRTIVLDLKQPEDAEVFTDLVAGSDVIVQNFTIGTAERLGIDEASVRVHAPGIVFLYLNTYGLDGPWAQHRGYAELANITTGVTERTIGDCAPPSGSSASMDFPRWTFTDYAAGVLGAFGALVGLYDRQRTGQGRLVETSLVRATALEQLLYIVASPPNDSGPRHAPASEPRGQKAGGWSPFQRLYATSDGTVFLGGRPDQYSGVWAALGVEPPGEPDGADAAATLEGALATMTTAAVRAMLEETGVGVHDVVPVRQLMERGGVADLRRLRLEDVSDEFGTVVMPGPVVRFGRTPMRPGALPGPFGADRAAILGETDRSRQHGPRGDSAPPARTAHLDGAATGAHEDRSRP